MKSFLAFVIFASALAAADLRLGIVGTDTSHVVAFARVLNDPSSKDYLPGARIVAAYKGGSPDLKESWDRVEKYAEELSTKHGVEIVPDIATLLTKVDAVLLESVDGRPHLAQFKEIAKGRKPVFIDKPLASTLKDALEIARAGREAGIRWFTSSSLRFGDGMPALKAPAAEQTSVIAWGPGPQNELHQLDMTWYGIHTVEILYALMGQGCEEVTRISSADSDVVTGKWKDGRIGVVHVKRPYAGFGAVLFTKKDNAPRVSGKDLYTGYRNLLVEIVKFFQGGPAPVAEEETLEMFRFMDAAQRSKAAGGAPVKLR
jgi:predicted dehydrogenase